MHKINDRKQPEIARSSKKRFSISREIANRRMSNSNLFSSEESKIRMIGSKHSVSSIKSKKKVNISMNKDISPGSSSFSSDSESNKESIDQSIILKDNIGIIQQAQSSFYQVQDKLILPNMSFEQDFLNPLDISDGIEKSILKIQFIDFEHRWGMKQDINIQKQCGGDQMLLSQASEGMSSHRSLKMSHRSKKGAFQSKLQSNHTKGKQQLSDSDDDDYTDNQQDVDKIKKKYEKLYERNPFEDPYYVKLKDLHGFERLQYEINAYNDDKQFLKLRKQIVYYSLFIPILCKRIIKSVLFKIIMSFLIIFNVTLYIYSQTLQDPLQTKNMERSIMICFLIELGIRIIASGVIIPKGAFFKNFQDIFDCILVVVYVLNINYPDIFIVDISPLRVITLLLYLGDIFSGLGVMLKALKQSFRFLLEALMIVGLFSVFFAITGVFMFQGLFNYRCQYDNGDETDGWIQCNQNQCFEEGMSCQYSSFTPKLPTSFNNVIYSYGQVLRTITMDDWSWVMFFTMRIYHPWTWFYYLLIIFVCGFFGFNLVIAVIKIHYAEATEENAKEEEMKQIQLKIKENKELPDRDIINVFDVAFLRYIDFFSVIQRYRLALRSSYRSIKLEDNINEKGNPNKTRILSAKQKKNDDHNPQGSLLKRIIYKIQNFTVKNILLPKFLLLSEKQKNVHIKRYTEDEIEIQILERLKSFQFSQLQSCVNQQIQQNFESEGDVLPILNFPDCEKKELEKEIINMRNIKIPVVYPDIKQKKIQQIVHDHKKLNPFPVRKVKRIILNQTEDEQNETNNSLDQNLFNQKQSLAQSHKLKTSQGDKKIPFSIKKQDQNYVYIQGYYLNYEGVSTKINAKIQKNKNSQPSNEFQYRLLRRKDLQQNQIQKKTWSGNDVLKLNEMRLLNFKDALKKLNFIDIQIWMLGFKGKIETLRKYSYLFITSQISQLFFDMVILINFTFLSLQGIANSVTISNEEDVSTIFLCIELVVRFFAFSFKDISQSPDYVLQSCIVVLNFIELTMSSVMTNLNEQNLRLIRGTKCLLFYRVLKYNKMAVAIGHIAQKTFKQYIYLTFLFFLVIFVYAMIGMEMYAGYFDQTEALGQLHSYDNIFKAFMTIFNILTNDDWYGVYVLGGDINYIFAVIYSYSMVIFLNYITYGLVLAILLDGFGAINKEMEELEEEKEQEEEKNNEKQEEQNSQITEQQEMHEFQLNLKPLMSQINFNEHQQKKSKQHLISNLMKSIRQVHKDILSQYPNLYDGIQCQQSLYLFNKENILRILCCRIITSKLFNYFMDMVLYFSIIVFALKTYNDYEIDSSFYPEVLQLIANILFLFEIIMGSIAKGMWMNKGAHITYTWQIVDVIYIIAFFLHFEQDQEQRAIVNFFLYFGYLRVMKLMYRISWLDTLRLALGRSLADIWNVLITMLSVWIIFGVYGIILYEQQFGFCEEKMEFYINKKECLEMNRTWINYKHNFDNITIAIPTLFVVSTFDGWGEIMQISENSQNPNIGPEPFNSYIHTYFFFISFCFIGSMFFLSLFTGVLYSNLKANQSKIEMSDITKAQVEFMEISQIIIKDFPLYSSPPTSTIRRFSSNLTNNNTVQKLMFCLLLFDLLVLLLFFTEMEDDFFRALNETHNSLTYIYILWNIFLFLALGVNRFFDNHWRRFYFFLITIAIIDIIADYESDWALVYFRSSPADSGYQFLRLFFALRCLRIILIFQGLINLQRLMRVMVFALPFLGKIFSLLIITMYIFALLGCHLYGQLEKGQVMDDQINFKNVAQAMLSLFKCASGDDWRTIMTDTIFYNPYCDENEIYCGSIYNQIYFFLFMLLSNYVLLNLFVLGLVEQFEQFFMLQNSMIQTYVENMDKIKTIWCKYSSETQGQAMHYKFLCRFLMDIGKPLGGGKDENLWDVGKLASSFKLQCDHFGYIQFNQLMYELFRVCYHVEVFKNGTISSIKKIKQFNKEMQLRLMYYRRNRFLQRSNISPILHLKANFNILHDYLTVLIMYKAWEAFSKKLIKKLAIKQNQFTEEDLNEQDSSFDQKTMNNQYFDQDCNEFLQEDVAQQVLSNEIPQQENIHQNTKCSDDGNSKKEDIPIYRWQKDQQSEPLYERAFISPEKQSFKQKKKF
ncbi:unnamed protein product [Paramecium sonneborni]|uniref:Ion transport domain-containing protein n=2 Tax=Paramecium sonneborni TaxID=65129 RepID=A0A8S1R3F7_9CILI|nr:unnamed protein product [Paramecium sonneborni]